MRFAPRLVLAGLLAAACAAVAFAQQDFYYGWRVPPRFAKPDNFDGSFSFCRLFYTSDRREDGGSGWSTDYPSADQNFSIRLSELTKTTVSRNHTGDPNFFVVRATDEAFFRCPFVIIEDAGTARFSELEVQRLREYLLKGGFMWSDDFWGEVAWDQWTRELGRVLPSAQYPIVDIPMSHPLFRSLFKVDVLPQIPSIRFWRYSGGGTSERGDESATPDVRGIFGEHGQLMVLMTHDTDIADAWEREGEDPRFFYTFSLNGYAVGLDVLVYAMAH